MLYPSRSLGSLFRMSVRSEHIIVGREAGLARVLLR